MSEVTNIQTTSEKNNSEWIKSTCAYCGVGCGIEAKVNASGKLDIRGDESHPANLGRLCSKGLSLGDTVTTKGRLLTPSIEGEATTWNTALNHVATSLNDIIDEHGPDAVAFYVSGQLLTEDYYAVNKLMKGFIGSANIDTNSRLCMASAVAGHKRAFGEDCVPGTYEDLEIADLVVLVGSNLAWCHPVLYQRLKATKEARGTKVVVIDPRRTSTCEIADLHLPLTPGSDIALFNGLLADLAKHGQLNQGYIANHTTGLDDALTQAQRFNTVAAVAGATGLKLSDIETFYRLFRQHVRTVTMFSQGVNQSTSGTDNANSILNCHIATGRVGLPGSTPFSITGQPNAMGGREVGGLANTLAAHLEFGNAEHSALVSDFWQTDRLATQQGLKAIDMFDAIESGKIKALWVMATNPAVSLPDSDRIAKILKKCPLVIVSDCVSTSETLDYAHVKLPAQGWSEKSGTVTNSERMISRQRRLLPTPGEGKPDWWIVSEVGKRMGFHQAFDYPTEAHIFQEYVAMTTIGNQEGDATKRKLNLSALRGLSVEEYNTFPPTRWPMVSDDNASGRLFTQGDFSTPDGKARFIAVEHKAPVSPITPQYSMILNSGRIRDQWHTMTRTGLSAALNAHTVEPIIEINPFDATDRGIKEGQLVNVMSHVGEQVFKAHVTNRVIPGQSFAPIHWNKMNCSGGKVTAVIPAHTDPISGQPEFKATPVSIKPLMMQSAGSLVTQRRLTKRQLHTFDAEYWVLQAIEGGYLYRFQFKETCRSVPPRFMTLAASEDAALIHGNAENGRRVVIYQGKTPQFAFSAFPLWQESEQPDISQLLASQFDSQDIHAFLSGSLAARSPIVCACKQVSLDTIEVALIDGNAESVQDVSNQTLAGTGCGSCTAEIGNIVDRVCARKLAQRKAG
ncbi:nitrate reductase [Enterovibrio norvegicus]|uniref:nitrate reductase n=1 Tax=Enterovibrio norvegicus TaxID=188144 RepID=UPI0024B04D53|nr:nitrate reductase [Enterovibrio norvegicus]